MTTVVHCKKEKFDIYIGRPSGNSIEHYGNPFSHLRGSKATVYLPSREECIKAHDEWFNGTAWQHIEPERRKWVLANIENLRDKVLACWCDPLPCHGDNYVKYLTLPSPKK